ncbi:hypothetical protein RDV89_04855 [Nocardioides zeae]|uniref:YtxH domain-containing protein n=1 Tax=Nocardioides imazamoxiresistens TaxID=3231893 RepID=A0ABU3PT18_9ACTN|nr:hypothetical protein [Nocardioides zeae]MDT9592383.1 hypothetical protein [Nocardioides zeae]
MRKLTLLVGIGIGYVLGTRAGTQRYEQLKAQAQRAWQNPTVQEKAAQAQDAVREAAPKVGEKAGEVAQAVAAKVRSDDESGGSHAASSQPGASSGA